MEAAQVEIPKKAVRALKSRLHVVREHLKPLLERPLSEIFTKLPIQERYELQVLLSYSLNSLYYSM
jgi:exosome complex protein LRP1